MKRNVLIFGLILGTILGVDIVYLVDLIYNNPNFEGNDVVGSIGCHLTPTPERGASYTSSRMADGSGSKKSNCRREADGSIIIVTAPVTKPDCSLRSFEDDRRCSRRTR